MKFKSKKLFVFGILFLVIMGISGIYALTIQTSNSIVMGGVNVKVKTYKLINGGEQEFDSENEVLMPGDTISFIPKIENNDKDCYVRFKMFYIADDIDGSNYVTGLSSDFKKQGDYFYYDKVLKRDENVKLFDAIKVPENISSLTTEKNIKLIITAEAVQMKNFTPDFDSEDPWNGVVPEENTGISYDIDTNKSNITVECIGDAEKDIKVPSDFLNDIKAAMPGDSYKNSIEIKNTDKKNVHYYVMLDTDEPELLNALELIITNKKGQVYKGKMTRSKAILLGEYGLNETDSLEFEILVPSNLKNEYANLMPKINFIFSAKYAENDKIKNPKTGDKINVAITMFLISSIGLITVLVLDKKNVDSK